MDLGFSVDLVQRQSDRVVVSVRVGREGCSYTLDGAALELIARDGRALGPRLAIPLSGPLFGCLTTTLELRALGPLPIGARVRGLLWVAGGTTAEATCPTDLWTELCGHVRGRNAAPLAITEVELDDVNSAERARLVAKWPWIAQQMCPEAPPTAVLEEGEIPERLDAADLAATFGLDGEGADALRDILSDE